MRSQPAIITLIMCIASANLGAQMKPAVTILNKTDATVELIPVDQAHATALPSALGSQTQVIPGGSFVLKNNSSKAITAMFVLWTFTDTDGQTQKHTYASDGYYIPGERSIIKPASVNLITPTAHVPSERFSALGAAGALDPILGSRVDHQRLTRVNVTIDSLIFDDGEIWGPDSQKYYLTLLNRRSVLQALSTELKEATGRGEDLKMHLEQVRREASAGDARTKFRRDYARFLQQSNTPESLLAKFETQASLPEFHHSGDNN